MGFPLIGGYLTPLRRSLSHSFRLALPHRLTAPRTTWLVKYPPSSHVLRLDLPDSWQRSAFAKVDQHRWILQWLHRLEKSCASPLSYLPCKVLSLMISSRIVDKVIFPISSACGDAYRSFRNHVVAPDFCAMSVDIRLSVDVGGRGAPDYSNSGYQVLIVPQIRFAWSGRNSWGEFTLLSPGFQ